MIGIVVCKYCGKEFYGTARAVFCCAKCRVYSNRREKMLDVPKDVPSK